MAWDWIGLGPVTGYYKVILIKNDECEILGCSPVLVYSSRTDSWRY